MAVVVTINRPDVVSLIEKAAEKLTGGNKTEAVAMAMRRLLDSQERTGSLFGFMGGPVTVRGGCDLTQPVFDENDRDSDPFPKPARSVAACLTGPRFADAKQPMVVPYRAGRR